MKALVSDAQFRVLHWLWMYPTVRIYHYPDHAEIMPRWCNEDARKHMISVMAILGTSVNVECRGTTQRGTPQMTQPTFNALCRKELIQPFGQRAPMRGFTWCVYYQLSDDGRRVVSESAKAG